MIREGIHLFPAIWKTIPEIVRPSSHFKEEFQGWSNREIQYCKNNYCNIPIIKNLKRKVAKAPNILTLC